MSKYDSEFGRMYAEAHKKETDEDFADSIATIVEFYIKSKEVLPFEVIIPSNCILNFSLLHILLEKYGIITDGKVYKRTNGVKFINVTGFK